MHFSWVWLTCSLTRSKWAKVKKRVKKCKKNQRVCVQNVNSFWQKSYAGFIFMPMACSHCPSVPCIVNTLIVWRSKNRSTHVESPLESPHQAFSGRMPLSLSALKPQVGSPHMLTCLTGGWCISPWHHISSFWRPCEKVTLQWNLEEASWLKNKWPSKTTQNSFWGWRHQYSSKVLFLEAFL